MFEKLVRHLACWHAKLKLEVSTLLARWCVNHALIQARRHINHVGTQARLARDLANSKKIFS